MVESRTLSVVVAIYNEEEVLPNLFERLRTRFAEMPDISAKVIYVNDGSTDGSLRLMLEQQAKDSRFTVIDLSRNFWSSARNHGRPERRGCRCRSDDGRRLAGSAGSHSRTRGLLAMARKLCGPCDDSGLSKVFVDWGSNCSIASCTG